MELRVCTQWRFVTEKNILVCAIPLEGNLDFGILNSKTLKIYTLLPDGKNVPQIT